MEIVKLLLQAGAPADGLVGERSPLGAASDTGRLEINRFLLAARADPNGLDSNGETPLCAASASGHADMLQLLLESGATVDAFDAHATPTSASRSGYHRRPHHSWNDSGTALCAAAAHGHVEVVQMLLQAGASMHVHTASGQCPVFVAAAAGRMEIVRLLMASGADIHVLSAQGESPLCAASGSGQVEIVRLLLDASADADMFDAT